MIGRNEKWEEGYEASLVGRNSVNRLKTVGPPPSPTPTYEQEL